MLRSKVGEGTHFTFSLKMSEPIDKSYRELTSDNNEVMDSQSLAILFNDIQSIISFREILKMLGLATQKIKYSICPNEINNYSYKLLIIDLDYHCLKDVDLRNNKAVGLISFIDKKTYKGLKQNDNVKILLKPINIYDMQQVLKDNNFIQ